jgi:hypothetical protein
MAEQYEIRPVTREQAVCRTCGAVVEDIVQHDRWHPSAQPALMDAHHDLAALAKRLEATGNKVQIGTAAGVRLAAFRLIELADRAGREGPAECAACGGRGPCEVCGHAG